MKQNVMKQMKKIEKSAFENVCIWWNKFQIDAQLFVFRFVLEEMKRTHRNNVGKKSKQMQSSTNFGRTNSMKQTTNEDLWESDMHIVIVLWTVNTKITIFINFIESSFNKYWCFTNEWSRLTLYNKFRKRHPLLHFTIFDHISTLFH